MNGGVEQVQSLTVFCFFLSYLILLFIREVLFIHEVLNEPFINETIMTDPLVQGLISLNKVNEIIEMMHNLEVPYV